MLFRSYEITSWQGVVLPARTPAAIVSRLHAETLKALQAPDIREALLKQGVSPQAESPAAFAAFIKADRARMAKIAQQVDIPAD